MELELNTPVTRFSGVGQARAKLLDKLGLRTVRDLLECYPRAYEDRRTVYGIRQAPLGEKVCVRALVAERPALSRVRQGLELVKTRAVDDFGTLYLTFFNQSYLQRALQTGEEYIFYGVVEEAGRRRSMTNPVFERADHPSVTGCIMPVYPLTAGVSNHLLATLVRQALPCVGALPETLPPSVRAAHALVEREFSVRNIHFPHSFEELELARRRLTFEELFYLAVGLTFLKKRRESGTAGVDVPARPMEEFLNLLPFPPTAAQRRVMAEISADLSSGRPMNRLVQGDVGSGKTAVAAFAAWLTVRAGHQAALMAPTEVLAEQHFRTLSTLLAPAGIRVGLLTGALPASEKKKTRQAIADGELDFIVGTHALISQGVDFPNLGLMVADEQHRFGVAQRAALAAKGRAPHALVMSATPIPRTLALIVYGDLDVSVIDELPPGRAPVETYVIREDKRARLYNFVRKQVHEGRQVYIICPAVEEGDAPEMDLKAVKTYADQLQKDVFPDLTVGLLHGKLRPKEKEAAMAAFASGATDILVSTTVVEVGMDVPNASLIVVENAERFGLSQLHQLRGRVGRGKHKSYCVLLTRSFQPEALERLRTLAATADGFKISEEDLRQRGPGDFFGSRQHGLPQMKLADLTGDMRLLSEAQGAAAELLDGDPSLLRPENAPVLERVKALFADTPDIFN